MRISKVHTERWLASTLLVLFWCIPGQTSGENSAASAPRAVHVYGSMIPLGSETFYYRDKKNQQFFYVLASAISPEFSGQQLWTDGYQHLLKTASGRLVEEYPHQLTFRISVSEHDGFIGLGSPLTVAAHGGTLNDFITALRFEIRINHALESRVLNPSKITHIGVPPDVPANERIYEVRFDLGEVPISDRIVMHVLTPEGERMAKFSLDFY